MSTTPPDEPEHDAMLRAALRHAPDRDARPPEALSAQILRRAQQATASASPGGPWQTLRQWLGALTRPAPAAAFASLTLATVIGVMWREGPPAEGPDAGGPSAPELRTKPLQPAAEVAAGGPTTPMGVAADAGHASRPAEVQAPQAQPKRSAVPPAPVTAPDGTSPIPRTTQPAQPTQPTPTAHGAPAAEAATAPAAGTAAPSAAAPAAAARSEALGEPAAPRDEARTPPAAATNEAPTAAAPARRADDEARRASIAREARTAAADRPDERQGAAPAPAPAPASPPAAAGRAEAARPRSEAAAPTRSEAAAPTRSEAASSKPGESTASTRSEPISPTRSEPLPSTRSMLAAPADPLAALVEGWAGATDAQRAALDELRRLSAGRWSRVPAAGLPPSAELNGTDGRPLGRLAITDDAVLWLPQGGDGRAWRTPLEPAAVADLRRRLSLPPGR